MSCDMSIDYGEIKRFVKAADNASKVIVKEAKKAVRSVARDIVADVKANTRVDTGRLKHGFSMGNVLVSGSFVSATVANSVEYAPYIEYGHRIVDGERRTVGFWEGDSMLSKATENAEGKLKYKCRAIVKKVEEIIKG